MLTYETLRNIEQEERNSTKLTKLPDNFFSEVRSYLDGKKQMAEQGGDKWELETAANRLNDILTIRERKVITFAHMFIRSGVIPGNMALEEREFFDSLVRNIRSFREKRKNVILSNKPVSSSELVAFLQDIPEFVGTDGRHYGPYQKGDMATVPSDNATMMIEKGMAERVNVKPTEKKEEKAPETTGESLHDSQPTDATHKDTSDEPLEGSGDEEHDEEPGHEEEEKDEPPQLPETSEPQKPVVF